MSFDRYAALGSRILKAAIGLVSLADAREQHLRGAHGLPEPWASSRRLPAGQSPAELAGELGMRACLAVPLLDATGHRLGTFCVMDRAPRDWRQDELETARDLAHAVVAEIALSERDEALTLAERSAGVGVWDIDLTTGLARGTPQFFRIMGLQPTSDRVPMEAIRVLRHPDDRERVLEGFQHAVSSGTDAYEMEYRVVRPDGEVRWIFGRGRVVRDRDGKPVRYSGVDLDITDRKAAEAALAASEERLRLAQEAAGIGTWDWDLASGVMRWSEDQWRLHGLARKRENPGYEDWKSAIHPEDRSRASAAVADAISRRQGYEIEYRVAVPEGTRWLSGRGTVFADRDGRPARLLGVSVDVTDRHAAAEALERRVEAETRRRAEAEARLHQAQKMEAVGQLTGGVAHDFNNILQVIMGNLEVLKRTVLKDGLPAPVVAESIETALHATRNAAQLTHRLLAFSRLQPLEPRLLEVNALIGELSEMVSRTLGETIRVETALAPGLWPTYADRHQLESALLNLVVNARDAMPEGGCVTLETANVRLDATQAAAEAVAAGQYVMLCVRDTGCGIPSELLGKVFEPFFTTKDAGKGSGLGLSMVYGFVSQSGGHVRIESEPGRGTAVRMYLPRSRDEAPSPAQERAARRPSRGDALPCARPGETVLVVEDNDEVRRYGVSALRDLGYRVLEAADGAAALQLLDSAQARRIDLVFSDVVLPGGMSGRALADVVLERRPGLPVLFTSGYARDALARRGEAHLKLLGKPYTLESLAAGVRETIDGAR